MKFKRDFIHLNPFQTIFIRPNGVSMSGRFDYIKKGAYSNLKYNTSNDTIEIISNLKNPNGLMCDFFDTKISKELVPDIYQDIIDNSIYRYGDLNYYGSLSNNNAVYDVDVCENQVVLTKKRDLKFYER